MTFRDQARIGSGRVRTGGGGGRGPQFAMGGIGGIIVVAVGLFFGLDLTGGGSGTGLSGGGGAVTAQGYERAACETGADANADVDCRIEFTAHSLDQVWREQLPQVGVQYREPGVTLFRGGVTTGGCGSADSNVGPFYCPADDTAYFDSSFFQVLEDRFGASSGPFAQEYVVAHEFGHHIQNLLGDSGRGNYNDPGATSAAVRSELQADCYAGVWAHYADSTPAPGDDQPLLAPLTETDIADALSAAASVGDDHIQSQSTGRVNPDSWTHGSSAQRQHWFTTGYRTGQVAACNTFDAPDLG